MKKAVVETDIVKEAVSKIKVKFLGNFKDFVFGEIYELTEEEALPYLVLGYATKLEFWLFLEEQ